MTLRYEPAHMIDGPTEKYTRRKLVLATGAVSASAIAGCLGSGSDGSGDGGSDDSDGSDSSSDESARVIIADLTHSESVVYDQSVQLFVTLENTGDAPAEQRVTVISGGESVTQTDVSLPAGTTEQYELRIPSESYFAGRYDFTVETADDSTRSSVTVENPNPYGKRTLTVGLNQETQPESNIDEVVQAALDYWGSEADSFAGYPISYRYAPDASDPDVLIKTVSEITSCGTESDSVLGCAPVVEDTPSETVVVELVVGYRQEWVAATLKHELGHTLGLGHDSPAEVMSEQLREYSRSYRERLDVVERYEASFEKYEAGQQALNNALDAWERGDFEQTEESARRARTQFSNAAGKIEEARILIPEPGDDAQVRELVSESHDHVLALKRAANSAVNMARAATGRRDPQPYRVEVNSHLDESETDTFYDSGAIQDAFGFPPDDSI